MFDCILLVACFVSNNAGPTAAITFELENKLQAVFSSWFIRHCSDCNELVDHLVERDCHLNFTFISRDVERLVFSLLMTDYFPFSHF